MPNQLDKNKWKLLLDKIDRGECTPFLGAGASFPTLPLGAQIAEDWAKQWDYPLQDTSNLPRVAQFIATSTDDWVWPKSDLIRQIRRAGLPRFQEANEPHSILAALPLPLYITTNYDRFMYEALKHRGKEPQRRVCQWNNVVMTDAAKDPEITELPPTNKPVVFHLHGYDRLAESLVLTEDDYFDFMVNVSREKDRIPSWIQAAMAGTTLLFMGYSLADWDFRVIFHSMLSYLGRNSSRVHISVQLTPGSANSEKAQEYLTRYFDKNLNVSVYWGTCRDFAQDLQERWDAYRASRATQSAECAVSG
jgi:hypothetical protein